MGVVRDGFGRVIDAHDTRFGGSKMLVDPLDSHMESKSGRM